MPLLTITEAATLLRVSKNTGRRRLSEWPGVIRYGRVIRIDQDRLFEYLARKDDNGPMAITPKRMGLYERVIGKALKAVS
jgi:hypothetical protein